MSTDTPPGGPGTAAADTCRELAVLVADTLGVPRHMLLDNPGAVAVAADFLQGNKLTPDLLPGGAMTPDQAHAVVLAGLSRISSALADTIAPPGDPGFATACAVLRGRRRIIERHAPIDYGVMGAVCRDPAHTGSAGPSWPCDDYRDAAADLFPEES